MFEGYGVGSSMGSITHQEYVHAVEKAKEAGGKVEYHHGRYWISVPLKRTLFIETPDDPNYSGYNLTLTWAGRESILVQQQQTQGNGSDYKWYQFFNDHNPGGDFLYEVNKWNPIANVYNAISTYLTGEDSYGVKQSNATATIQLASAIPIFKLSGTVTNVSFSALRQGIAKTLSNPNSISHIMAAKHNLGPLVQQAGSEANLVRRLYLSLGQSGGLPSNGTFEVTTAIYGSQVTIRGAMINSVPRIATAFIP
ncbi:MAG: hypothetical protein KF763_19895 [Cyclobacteriaceae bacterium]|nr:hypothetical protein [Cyclobacteriaceae bacterium]